ncbi:MAG: hypothetical protein HY453_01940 [Parcubacteria group bacterium]|nr:hypothetical protein [Parcubacteria group bacterium]
MISISGNSAVSSIFSLRLSLMKTAFFRFNVFKYSFLSGETIRISEKKDSVPLAPIFFI